MTLTVDLQYFYIQVSASNNKKEFSDPVPDIFLPEDYIYRIDQAFVRECAELIQKHLTPMINEVEKMDMQMKEKRKM